MSEAHLEAIDFTDEEGTLVGLLGSAALAGKLTVQELESSRGGREDLLNGLARAGLTEAGLLSAGRDPHTLAGYLELHIEQGPRLRRAGIPIGIVTGIVGISSYRLTFNGGQPCRHHPHGRAPGCRPGCGGLHPGGARAGAG